MKNYLEQFIAQRAVSAWTIEALRPRSIIARHALAALAALSGSCWMLASEAQAQDVNWSGPYLGVFGEYATGTSSQTDNGFVYRPPRTRPATPAPPTQPQCDSNEILVDGQCLPRANGDGNYRLSGAFGGGHVGYNYQFAHTVLGIEGAIGGGRAAGSSPFCGTPAHTCGTSVDAIADVRGRLGYAFGRFLPFIAGGLAVDHVNAYDNLFGARGSGWLPGWTVGAGLEYRLSPRWSVRAEYRYTEIDPKYLYDITTNVPERVGVKLNSVRVGLSYYFAPVETVIAKY